MTLKMSTGATISKRTSVDIGIPLSEDREITPSLQDPTGTQRPLGMMPTRQYISFMLFLWQHINRSFLSPHRFGRCRCDVECGRYGDCCADAVDVYDIESRSSLTSQWTCLPMRTERDRYRSDQNVSFCYVPFTSTTAHLFRSYLFTLASFFWGGGGREGERERVDFILPFPFGSLIQADVNKLSLKLFV